MSDKNNKFFDRERFCEVYTGTVEKVVKQKLPDWSSMNPARTVFIKPFDKKTKWLIIDAFCIELPEGIKVEICCFNGSLQLAYKRAKNYVITQGQILNIEFLDNPKEFSLKVNASITDSKEESLEKYIDNMRRGVLGYDKKRRDSYISSAKLSLRNLQANRLSDPDRYETLDKEYRQIKCKFAGYVEGRENLAEVAHELYDRLDAIGKELTTLWDTDADLENAFDFSNL